MLSLLDHYFFTFLCLRCPTYIKLSINFILQPLNCDAEEILKLFHYRHPAFLHAYHEKHQE